MFLYLDTSSLVKLYVEEEGSEQVALRVVSASYCATSIVAYAEARAAFARRSREQAFTLEDYQQIKFALERDWSRYVVLTLDFSLVAQAGELAEKHALRGFDSIHLASAISLRDQVASSVVFSAWDARLLFAAKAEGLE
jgi:uncharacterized protein